METLSLKFAYQLFIQNTNFEISKSAAALLHQNLRAKQSEKQSTRWRRRRLLKSLVFVMLSNSKNVAAMRIPDTINRHATPRFNA